MSIEKGADIRNMYYLYGSVMAIARARGIVCLGCPSARPPSCEHKLQSMINRFVFGRQRSKVGVTLSNPCKPRSQEYLKYPFGLRGKLF